VSDSAILTSARSSFHHYGARTEKSWDLAERCLPVPSEGGTSRLTGVVERSTRAGAWGLTNLEVGRGSFTDSLVGQYQYLESNASDYREPVEVAEEGGYIGEFFWQVEHQAHCCALDAL